VFSLFRFLHPHHPSSTNARYLCELVKSTGPQIHPLPAIAVPLENGPTFYPTAQLAMESPAERYSSNERPDAITTIAKNQPTIST
jgi:hypothetical protein